MPRHTTDKCKERGIDEEDIRDMQEIWDQMEMDEMPPNLRHVEKKKLKIEISKTNAILELMNTSNITDTNKLLRAAACVVAKHMGFMKKKQKKADKEPWWKKRIKKKIDTMRKEVSRLERWKKQEIKNRRLKDEMRRKYQLDNKSIKVRIEELKRRITANSMKLKRYEARIEQYTQNRLFETNQKKLFEKLEKRELREQAMPDKEEATQFWNGIWNQSVNYNESAD